MEFNCGVAVPSAKNLSDKLRRATMSAARSSMGALGLQKVQFECAGSSQYGGGGGGVPLSTHKPEGTWVILPVVDEKDSCWPGSLLEHTAVVMSVPLLYGAGAVRHVGGVCILLIDVEDTTQSSFNFEPRPQGHAHTIASGAVLKSEMSMHMFWPWTTMYSFVPLAVCCQDWDDEVEQVLIKMGFPCSAFKMLAFTALTATAAKRTGARIS